MKAVILAAGVGSRLNPLTLQKPKCMIRVCGKPILDYQIEAMKEAGIRDIFIVTGYRGASVEKHLKSHKKLNPQTIHNEDFEFTNNMYSLYLARDQVYGEPFVLCNGDVIFSREMFASFVASEEQDLIAADRESYSDESMKVTQNDSGIIDDISKTILEHAAAGCSIDVYKFSARSSQIFLDHVSDFIETKQDRNSWTEVALQELFQTGGLSMKIHDVSDPWVEIDDYEDLLLAERLLARFDPSSAKMFFLDMDGTLFLGNKLLEGAVGFIDELKKRGIGFYLLSNNSSRSRKDYVEDLARMGLQVEDKNILLSTDALIDFLKEHEVRSVYTVGTRSMKEAIRDEGIAPESLDPEYVLLGFDTELDYEKLKTATLFLQNGVDLLATHCDLVCPTPEGNIPDIGSMLALFETATGRKPLKVFGKPDPGMISHLLERHGLESKDVVMVGDRLYTDMQLARNAEIPFVLTLTGEASRDDLEDRGDWPDLVVPDLSAIFPS